MKLSLCSTTDLLDPFQHYRALDLKSSLVKATGGVRGQKNMLILFERFNRCGVNAFYGMSKFCFVHKLSAFQCVGALTFL